MLIYLIAIYCWYPKVFHLYYQSLIWDIIIWDEVSIFTKSYQILSSRYKDMCIYSLDHIHIYIQYIPVPIIMSAVYCYGQILTYSRTPPWSSYDGRNENIYCV